MISSSSLVDASTLNVNESGMDDSVCPLDSLGLQRDLEASSAHELGKKNLFLNYYLQNIIRLKNMLSPNYIMNNKAKWK